ncbi:MAG: glycine betaine ABC transporter substrate-binding protein [Desulfovibrio sp.]|nr:glycine betaine ABC transporter substrate-binding protein [Desulfovibrio sp.]MCA1985981.1 glycine betaine ABC transporter substrate-binding protein [Desulfovibrio sp.]
MQRLVFKLLMVTLALSLSLPGVVRTAQAKGPVNLVYVEWSSEVASTNVVKALLEQAGYTVDITPVSAAAMWQALASDNSVDGMVAAWLPTTHGHYLDKVKDKVEDLGPNLTGTRIGLVVPDYVTISSIEELNAHADKFKGQIVGIDPGAGLMSKTEKVLEEYKLDKLTLMEGSGATMTAALADATKNNQWVAVTGWTPHWKFAKWKLKYLEDPKNVYGGDEFIHTIVRKDLKKDKPEVHAILDRFSWSPDDMATVMIWIEDGMAPEAAAKKWLAEHPEQVKAWLGQ